jgi:hypothetical protein
VLEPSRRSRISGARQLADRDLAQVLEVLDTDPVAGCMVAARLQEYGLDNRGGGELWTRGTPADSLCFSGANLVPLRVAVMGCVVNGPGEAREADLGVASGNGKGQIFVKGHVIKTVPEAEIVQTLIAEANRIAAELGPDAAVGPAQVVTA